MRSYSKSTRGLEHETPPERRYRRECDLISKHSGARARYSPRETLSSRMRSHFKALGGSSMILPPRDAIVANAILFQSTRGLGHNTPPKNHRHHKILSGARTRTL